MSSDDAINWLAAPMAALRAMPCRQAARVDAAVIRFAETGRGWVERVTGDRRGLRLLVPPYAVRLEIDMETGHITVLSVFRRG